MKYWKRQSWGDWAIFAIGFVTIGFFGSLIAYLVFRAIDSWFIKDHEGIAVVTSRSYSPETFTSYWVSTGDNGQGHMQIVHVPATYSVGLRMTNEFDWVSTSPGTYEKATNGQPVRVQFRHGRISGKLYIWHAEFQ